MRSFSKYGMMVAAVALMASSTAAKAADADIQALQKQIDALSQQLNAMKAQPAGMAATPTKNPYDVLMTDPTRGAFVIPGTNTTLHVGGFIDLQATFDTGSSVGPAGYAQLAGFNSRSYVANSVGSPDSPNIALPGTPFAKATERFQMDPRFSRLNIQTDTPSEFGDIGTVVEMDFDGDGLTASQKSTYSVSPRLRRAFVTVGNFVIGQTQQLTYDGPTNVASIDNNEYMGQEAGNRWPQIQYRWNIDPAQKHQVYFSVEAPYSDVVGISASSFTAGGNMAYQTDVTSHVPDFSAKFVENGDWGRFFAAGVLRNIEVNTDGVPGSTAFSAGAASAYPGAIVNSIWGYFVDTGAKFYTGIMHPKSAVYVNAEYGTMGARNANYSGGNSAVVGSDGKLHAQPTWGFDVGYQQYLNDHWQANLNYGLQYQWNKEAYQSTLGLWKQGQEAEFNVFWMPTTYLNFGVAWLWIEEDAVMGQCVSATSAWSAASSSQTCTGAALPGTLGGISGSKAYDNRFEFRTRVTF